MTSSREATHDAEHSPVPIAAPGRDRAERLAPIFVLGIEQRSGTNYLASLIAAHPDCAASPIAEAFLTAESARLEQYVDAVYERWPKTDGVGPGTRAQLLSSLGRGIEEFLQQSAPSGVRTVTKTPSVRELQRFLQLFPQGQAVVLVRDGRALVESHTRSFGTSRERITREWARGARSIQRLRTLHGVDHPRLRVVRYEDLYEQPRDTIAALLAFLRLEPSRYNFDALEDWPVYGSSELRTAGSQVHWQPVGRDESFNPLARWHEWTPAQLARFNHLAGAELRMFGYEPVEASGSGRARSLRDRILDLRWATRDRLIRAFEAAGLKPRLLRLRGRLRRIARS